MSFDSERRRFATGDAGDTGDMRTAMRLAREAGDSAAPQASPLQILAKALAMIAMPIIVLGLAGEYQSVPGKFELSVFLSRVTFPYLFFISLVAMLSGLLNARSRFAPGAIAPVLFNLVLIGGIITGYSWRGESGAIRERRSHNL